MMLEQFGFGRHTAAGDSTGTSNSGLSLLESTQPVSSQPTSSQLAPSQPKKRRYNVKWGEGREWLQYDDVEGMMFCSMCRKYDRNEHQNQFVHGCSSMKVESVR